MVDALSKYEVEYELAAIAIISFPTPVLLQGLKQPYSKDLLVQDLITKLQQNSSSLPLFSLKHGVLFLKGRIYIPKSQQFKL